MKSNTTIHSLRRCTSQTSCESSSLQQEEALQQNKTVLFAIEFEVYLKEAFKWSSLWVALCLPYSHSTNTANTCGHTQACTWSLVSVHIQANMHMYSKVHTSTLITGQGVSLFCHLGFCESMFYRSNANS